MREACRLPIYLDHLASTPLDPAVRAAMLPWLEAGAAGNPHSEHAAGWRAAKAVEAARESVAALIGAQPAEILFTSGATEANNLALFGLAERVEQVIVSAIEHPSVLEPARVLAARGHRVHELPVDETGKVDLDALESRLALGPALVSVMAANNEIGSLQPLSEIAALCRASGALLHSDAAQLLSTQGCDVAALGVDLLSLSGHKLYGPAGIGALYLRRGVALRPRAHGGGQQGGLRPGTLPVALCVGFGEACRLAAERAVDDGRRIAGLRERLFALLSEVAPGILRNSPATDCLPGCLNVSLPGVDAAQLLLGLPELAISTGSACASAEGGASHVLLAIGRSVEEAHASLRFGLGRTTSEAELDAAVAQISAALRAPGPRESRESQRPGGRP